MKKIIMLVIMVIVVVGCTELSEMEARRQQRLNERGGVECRYNKRGGVENCRYAN